jgi:alkylation response protein AidB-like acyl-CoA dehydrogenase
VSAPDAGDEREKLRAELRALLGGYAGAARARALAESEPGYPRELWRELGARGWLGLAFPEAVGGSARGWGALGVLAEELGRAACPLPLQTGVVQSGAALLALRDPTACARLPEVLQGRLRPSLGLLEPGARLDASGVQLQARRDGAGWRLDGVKRFVAFARGADALLVAARTASDGEPERGVSLFWVEPDAPGLEISPLHSLADDAPCELRLGRVRVPAAALLGAEGAAWPALAQALERGTAVLCAEMAGGARAALEFAVDYVKRRVQFERPIGAFQAVQHRAADMLIDVEAAELAARAALERLDAGGPAALEVSLAKITCSEAFARVTASAQQICGGVGFYADLPLGLWYRRARALAPQLGDARHHRERVAQLLDEERADERVAQLLGEERADVR